ncbi:alpha/beta hydrolase [Thermopolyspora sp. NPDC052614]|uniref:alpha/beta hydrolase n=1 Tax=Thermopolyspora sp. NPDC052614 TaxID=3155682 RepID=UPI00343FFA65
MKRKAWAAALVATAALGITPAPANAQDEPRLETASIGWKPCSDDSKDSGDPGDLRGSVDPGDPGDSDVECGTVTVPIDWSRPGGPKIDIALARRRATEPASRIGALLVNPGGPGGSGFNDVRAGGMAKQFPAEVRRRFDIIGFDPRGVGRSHQIRCRPLTLRPEDVFPVTTRQFRRLGETMRAHGESCRQVSGPLFDFVDSASVARDMDAIREGLGEDTLNFYGNSYGTLLGQQYARLFPERVRAMVLDSTMDHSRATTWDFLRSEAKAVQDGFDQYVAWCRRSTDCALHGKDVRRVFAELRARAERGTLVDPRTSEPKTAFDLLADAQYAFFGPYWKSLSQDHAKMLANRPRTSSTSRPVEKATREETVENPSMPIFCQDWRLPVRGAAEVRAYLRGLARVAPDMRLPAQAWAATISCVGWPTATRVPQEPPRWKGVPVLLINSRYDPATPHEWARNVARQSGAALLTYDGWGHGVYSLGSACAAAATERYLLSLRTPPPGSRCPAVEPRAE